MYDSADTKRLSKELLVDVSQGGESVQIQCIDVEDTEKTFNRLNVQRHRQQLKGVKINYNLVTFVLTIVQKVTMSAKPDIAVSSRIRTKRAKPVVVALPACVDIDLGEKAVMDQGDIGAAVAIATTATVQVASRSQERRHAAQKAKPTRERVDPNDKPSTAPARKTQPAGLPPLDLWEGKRCREHGKCFHCAGELILASDHHYHQRVFEESSQRAYAVDICCHCVGHKVQ